MVRVYYFVVNLCLFNVLLNHVDMFPVPSFIDYSKKMLNDSFDGNEGFHLEGGLKDAKYVFSSSSSHT